MKDLALIIILCIPLFLSCTTSSEPDNKTPTAEGVIEFVLYDGLTSEDTKSIEQNFNENYLRILSDLNVTNMPTVKFLIWKDYDNFLDVMESDIGTRYTGATGYIYGGTESRLFFNSDVHIAAVHEFAHIVSLQVNPTIANNPRWLWEAVALYENNEFVDPKNLSYMVSGNYPTLDELSSDFNSSNHYVYSVGYTILEYIIETWDMDMVIDLIKNNGNIENTLEVSVRNFELGWNNFVEYKYLK